MTDWTANLCTELGIHAQYRDFDGHTVHVPQSTQSAVLRAMGLDVGSDAAARAHLEHIQGVNTARPLPLEVIVDAGAPRDLVLAHPADWTLEAEGTGAVLARGRSAEALALPAAPLGIHRLRLVSNGTEYTTWVLARPARAVQLGDHIPGTRIWGGLAALYGLTDGDAAQIGTYELLGKYAAAMAAHGADFLGINPVHAMGQVRPGNTISPYSPSHRAFLNPWHCSGAQALDGDAPELVDYPAALHANEQALSQQFSAFRTLPAGAPETQAFEHFCAQAGSSLDEFALFDVLSGKFGADCRTWPARYRDQEASALGAFAAKHAEDIAQTKWAQWQADTQLQAAQAHALASGMRVGLYLDLAVGPRLGGAETWGAQTSLTTSATLGAPPDPLGPQGQSWGLAPLCPIKSRAEGYAGFARLLRATMRHSGMIRIDHVLGLMRSFWIPEGAEAGTYVSYPFDALLAVVAIESARNNTIVVGEDLGLVPEGLREKLAASGIYGLDVLQYMRTQDGGFVDPSETRDLAVCTFATHDTPTVAGFFAGEDARVRHDIGMINADTLAETRADRAKAQVAMTGDDPVRAVHRQLARATASMVAVQLDDVAGRLAQQNLPGTVETYPNWQFKAPVTIAQIAAMEPFAQLAHDMRAQGRSNPKSMET